VFSRLGRAETRCQVACRAERLERLPATSAAACASSTSRWLPAPLPQDAGGAVEGDAGESTWALALLTSPSAPASEAESVARPSGVSSGVSKKTGLPAFTARPATGSPEAGAFRVPASGAETTIAPAGRHGRLAAVESGAADRLPFDGGRLQADAPLALLGEGDWRSGHLP
jgi:hypothetical protein